MTQLSEAKKGNLTLEMKKVAKKFKTYSFFSKGYW